MSNQVNPTSSATATPLPIIQVAPRAPAQAPAASGAVGSAEAVPAGAAGKAPAGVPAASSASLDAATKDFQAFLAQHDSSLQFLVDKSTGLSYFKVVDAKTKQVILQMPSEDTLAMARKLRELADTKGTAGVLVDKQG